MRQFLQNTIYEVSKHTHQNRLMRMTTLEHSHTTENYVNCAVLGSSDIPTTLASLNVAERPSLTALRIGA